MLALPSLAWCHGEPLRKKYRPRLLVILNSTLFKYCFMRAYLCQK